MYLGGNYYYIFRLIVGHFVSAVCAMHINGVECIRINCPAKLIRKS